MNPIIILGFGRSGTTWVSDIISKSSGSLILFEPLHPSVTDFSERLSYSPADSESTPMLEHFFADVLDKRHRKMWLLRNHVPVRLEEVSSTFLDLLWDNCSVSGFKEIRANFLIPWLHEKLSAKIVFVMRHPCAVVASILRRLNFWEFGWPGTYELFLKRTVFNSYYGGFWNSQSIRLIENAEEKYEQYAIMWAITHSIALSELQKLNLSPFYYEDFYSNPFQSVRNLLDYLAMSHIKIHPAHIFTPSMTTLKTLHGLHDMETSVSEKGSAFFWQDVLTFDQVDQIIDIAESFGVNDYNASGFPCSRLAPSARKHL